MSNPQQPKQKPLEKDGDIAVFAKTLPVKSKTPGGGMIDKPYYQISDGPQGDRLYTLMQVELLGAKITPAEALSLYKGETIILEGVSKDEKPFQFLAGSAGVTVVPKTKGEGAEAKTYENRYLDVRTALPVRNNEGSVVAFNIRHGEGENQKDVTVNRFFGKKESPIEIGVGDAVNLLDGVVIEKDGVKLSLREIKSKDHENGKTYYNADVAIQWPQRSQAPQRSAAVANVKRL